MTRTPLCLSAAIRILAFTLLLPAAPGVQARPAAAAPGDSLRFAPAEDETTGVAPAGRSRPVSGDELPRAPFGEHLVTDPETWRRHGESNDRTYLLVDYNRVDRLRIGGGYELQRPETLLPRAGARLEYAIQRDRVLYGFQVEQPLFDARRFAIGASVVRRTDHNELEQLSDVENSLALVFGRQDYRDYFEREGFGGYVAARLPDITTFSVNARNDTYRSLALDRGVWSMFDRNRALRPNPPIDPGESHTLSYRLEHRARRVRLKAGFYHWIDLERAGHGLGGAFEYTRLLADLRSVVRLTPVSAIAVRAVAGHTLDGALPVQRTFSAGGVDGLRAHAFGAYRGNELLLTQTEYTLGLPRLTTKFFESGVHLIAFLDAGRAWHSDAHRWDIGRQHVAADGGLGIGTSEDNLRVYFAKDLHESKSDILVSVRLRRPF